MSKGRLEAKFGCGDGFDALYPFRRLFIVATIK